VENPAAANADARLALEESLPSVAKSRGSARATASQAAFHRSSPIHNGSTGLCFYFGGGSWRHSTPAKPQIVR
jgi:hypothetical protein